MDFVKAVLMGMQEISNIRQAIPVFSRFKLSREEYAAACRKSSWRRLV